MWIFKTRHQLKSKASELSDFIGEWIRRLDHEPSRREIKTYLEASKELLSLSEDLRGVGLNMASRRLTEILGLWHAQAGRVEYGLDNNPCYRHAVDLIVKIEKAIAKI